jgi:hypothetical protein
LVSLARPEGLEPPAYWFEAEKLQEINDFDALLPSDTRAYSFGSYQRFGIGFS